MLRKKWKNWEKKKGKKRREAVEIWSGQERCGLLAKVWNSWGKRKEKGGSL